SETGRQPRQIAVAANWIAQRDGAPRVVAVPDGPLHFRRAERQVARVEQAVGDGPAVAHDEIADLPPVEIPLQFTGTSHVGRRVDRDVPRRPTQSACSIAGSRAGSRPSLRLRWPGETRR